MDMKANERNQGRTSETSFLIDAATNGAPPPAVSDGKRAVANKWYNRRRWQCCAIAVVGLSSLVLFALFVIIPATAKYNPNPEPSRGVLPGDVTSPTSTAINSTSITLTWDAPSPGSAQILRYCILYLLRQLQPREATSVPKLQTMLFQLPIYPQQAGINSINGINYYAPSFLPP